MRGRFAEIEMGCCGILASASLCVALVRLVIAVRVVGMIGGGKART